MNNEPIEYDLTKLGELHRLYRELLGYMKVSLGSKCPHCHKKIKEGTDFKGREFAIKALEQLLNE